jgi:AbiJ N-terminal domain 4
MLTDIFARRYEQPRMWETFSEEPRRLLVQGCQLLNDLCPYYVDGNENKHGKDFWIRIHDLLARELGLNEEGRPPKGESAFHPQLRGRQPYC